MNSKWFIRVMLLLLLIGVVGILLLGFRALLPINPVEPFFPLSGGTRMATKWSTREFQPVYLYMFEREKIPYIKVAYRGLKNEVRLADVALGIVIDGELSLATIQTDTNKWQAASSSAEFSDKFHLGDRIKIMYLINSTKGEGDFSEAIDPNDPQIKSFCDKYIYICKAAMVTKMNQIPYRNIEKTGRIPRGLEFIGISVSNLLLEK